MFKKVVIGAAAVSIGAVFLFLPVSMFVCLAVAVAIALAATGALKAAASGPLAAPSLAIAFAVACICFTVIVLASISASAPVRISQADLDKAVSVATVAERTRMGIDVQNANGRAAVAERDLKAASAEWQKSEQALAKLKQEYATLRLAANANAVIVMQTRPDIRARAEASMRGQPEPVWDYCAHPVSGAFAPKCETAASAPQFRAYHESRILVAGQFVSGEIRADCAQPAPTRIVEWRRSSAGTWQDLRGATYKHLAQELGAMACA